LSNSSPDFPRIVGADPGSDGALALLLSPSEVECYLLPEHPQDLLALFAELAPTHVFVERVSGRGGWNATANFTFGRNYERILCCAKLAGHDPVLVGPQEWQRLYGIRSKGSDVPLKDQSAGWFARLWPRVGVGGSKNQRGGQMEAALIARYGWSRVCGGTI